jgi:mannosyl-oligosaccharide alpha-1,2-mannosidase
MWPVVVNAKDLDFSSDDGFTLSAMADSTYEYLPKVKNHSLAHYEP